MGVCQSLSIDEVAEDAKLDRKEDAVPELSSQTITHKIVLVGPPRSGKTTVFEQLKNANNIPYSDDELLKKKFEIYSNLILGMKSLLKFVDEMSIKMNDEQWKCRKLVESYENYVTTLEKDLLESLQTLWKSDPIVFVFKNKINSTSTENIEYFFKNLDRISDDSYIPTTTDILNVYTPTKDVIQMNFDIEKIHFNIFDVGGSKSERKKWIPLFEEADTILFIVSVNEFDQKNVGEKEMNSIEDASFCFFHIVSSEYLRDKSMIVFLNKTDLFRKKIENTQISTYFPEFITESPLHVKNNYENGIFFFQSLFKIDSSEEANHPYIHETCALTDDIGKIMSDSVINAINREKASEVVIE